MTRNLSVTDDFDGKPINLEQERSYQIDVLTNTTVGKNKYFTKGTFHLRHKNFMDLVGGKVKVPFQMWEKYNKREQEDTGEKGHWIDMPSGV